MESNNELNIYIRLIIIKIIEDAFQKNNKIICIYVNLISNAI